MRTTLTEAIEGHTDPDGDHALYRWQTELGPGDLCVFPLESENSKQVKFVYMKIEPRPETIPEGFLYGTCFSDLSPEAGYGAIHPSLVLSPLTAYQFTAAKKCGFRSSPDAVMAVIGYSSKRGNA